MTEEMNDVLVIEPEAPDLSEIKEEKRSMRRCFSRCGWSTFTVTAAMLATSLILSIVIGVLEEIGVKTIDFYLKYLLIFNEVLVAVSVFLGMLVLLRMEKKKPEKTKMSAKGFMAVVCVCFLVGSIGNLIGNIFLTIWNGVTGNEVTNELAGILMNISPWQMILCTAILAPILEEFFFRKLLIDRMNKHGEFVAIVISALLFGLFHQNFSQFFYAFGLGLVFGYVYCRTGSYIVVTLLHAVFNFVSGVIPALLSVKILGFSEAVADMTEAEMLEMLPSLIGDYGAPLLLYVLYLMVMGALNIAGVIILIINSKKINVEHHDSRLSISEQRKAALLNAGMIVAIAALAVMMIISLFPQ